MTMSELITDGMTITIDKHGNVLLEFPYGDGVACELVLTKETAAKLAVGLLGASFSLGLTPNDYESILRSAKEPTQ